MTQTKRQKTEEPFPRRIIPVIGDSKVIVGRGLLTSIPAELTPANGFKASKFVVVSDSNVWPLYGEQLVGAFLALGFSVKHSAATELHPPPVEAADNGKLLLTYQVAAGEGSKCRETKAAIEDFMLEHRCNRDTVMIALGGGVVGDLIGYVAATFMRGVPVVQIPTSSTAMIDSSVGGKTAINVPAGKNLIGAFHQPVVVYADMDLLRTLPPRELVEGISEAIKMGVIRIPSLFDLLEAHPQRVMALDPELIEQVMYDSIRGKAEVVALDEREAGIRSTLKCVAWHTLPLLPRPAPSRDLHPPETCTLRRPAPSRAAGALTRLRLGVYVAAGGTPSATRSRLSSRPPTCTVSASPSAASRRRRW